MESRFRQLYFAVAFLGTFSLEGVTDTEQFGSPIKTKRRGLVTSQLRRFFIFRPHLMGEENQNL